MLGLEVGIVLVGGALLLLARVQRVTSRRVQRMMLHDALTAPEPAARRAAIQVVGDGGLSRFAGREFTVDVLVARDGTLAGAVPRWRHEIKAGISTKGATFRDDALVLAVDELLTAVGLRGPANVQGFMTAADGPVFVEVNPRFSGGLPLSLAAGADFVGEYLEGAFGRTVRPERLAYRPGVTMSRYLDEVCEP